MLAKTKLERWSQRRGPPYMDTCDTRIRGRIISHESVQRHMSGNMPVGCFSMLLEWGGGYRCAARQTCIAPLTLPLDKERTEGESQKENITTGAGSNAHPPYAGIWGGE
ncbi:hypothetical protein CgunFtcFv8_007829 [Champsocephalus gunnari]|uniref:Uncharacterized protein n=1 Tax=Champsocephalus gunnari TaxID=52237 RepID=A0AAN8HI88_CHAGU|nr:hypothetical protein CgunFtcFv8_007829 [Champsocephalus gunnari]